MLVGKSEVFLGGFVFVFEIAVEKGWIVGVECDHEAGIEVAAEGVIFDERAAAGAQVGCDADFEGNLALGEEIHEFGIVDCGKGMAESLGADVDSAPDAFGSGGLAGMGGEAEASVARFCVEFAERLGAGATLVAANANADDGWKLGMQFRGFAKNLRRFFRAEVADSIENPVDGDAKFGFCAGAGAFHTGKERLEVAASPVIDDPDRDVDLGVNDALGGESLKHAPGDEFVVIGGEEVFAHRFERHEEAGKVSVLIQSGRLGKVERHAVVARAQLDQRLRGDCTFKMQM